MSVSPNSRLNYSVLLRVIDTTGRLVEKEHLGLRPRLLTTNSSDLREYSPIKNDNWSRISWKFLGNGRFWWVIADYSGVVDPFEDLKPRAKINYLTQLTVDMAAGTVNSITVDRPKRLKRGMRVTVEDLNPSSPTSIDISVLSVDDDTGVVQISPVELATTIPFALSRVSQRVVSQVRLKIPPANRVLFESLDFNNPLNTLVE